MCWILGIIFFFCSSRGGWRLGQIIRRWQQQRTLTGEQERLCYQEVHRWTENMYYQPRLSTWVNFIIIKFYFIFLFSAEFSENGAYLHPLFHHLRQLSLTLTRKTMIPTKKTNIMKSMMMFLPPSWTNLVENIWVRDYIFVYSCFLVLFLAVVFFLLFISCFFFVFIKL